MKEPRIIEVSSKHVVLRTVLFAAAFVIAIGSIAFGLISYTKKTPGWQEASATLDSELPSYSSGFHTLVYLEGSSSEIREQLSTFNKLYSDSLKRTYRFLDCENTYDGYVNMASLNANLGKKVKVARELYEVLEDAWKKTQLGQAHLFAGPLYRAQVTLDYSENYDTSWENQRLEVMQTALSDLSNFTVEFYPDCYVLIDVSENFKSIMREYEFNTPILDLGENSYFYKTVLMNEALEKNGYSGCLFYSD